MCRTEIARLVALSGLSLLLTAGSVSAQEINKVAPRLYQAADLILPGESSKGKNAGALKLDFSLKFSATADSAGLSTSVREFLANNAKALELDLGASVLAVSDVKKTLTGSYVEYEQLLKGIPILTSRISVSVDKTGTVQRLYRDVMTVPGKTAEVMPAAPKLSSDNAYDVVWKALNASGEVLEPPSSELAYLPTGDKLALIYVVRIATSEPFGYWEYLVDALSGDVIRSRDRAVNEAKNGIAAAKTTGDQPSADRAVLFSRATARALDSEKKSNVLTTAEAVVFDPNPVTTSGNASLLDDASDAQFAPAYVTVTIPDVSVSGTTLSLAGPYVTIADFESPDNPPSTTTSAWTARRGDNSFNDVMTYFHLANSLRYLEKIGFSGSAALFTSSLWADSDGVNGDDNSHYVPGSDRIAFGHGCVDDNEDTDVILHEFGHAIHNHVNSNWSFGRDEGAIGEGFGDYWAFSYRYRTPNGRNGDFAKIFVWDGIASCWPGRRGDQLSARYDPSHTYGAHENLPGFVSDELWSTPLISSFVDLVNAGQTPESVDQIVVTAMSADRLPNGFTMADAAKATVDAARELFPDGPHADVLAKNFALHGLLP